MAHNHLEQLLAEWYQYRGYCTWVNVEVHKGEMDDKHWELDLIAFKPGEGLVHVECSDQAAAEAKYLAKFAAADFWIQKHLSGLAAPRVSRLIVFRAGGVPIQREDVRIMLLDELLGQIIREFRTRRLDYHNRTVPQTYPLLRTVNLLMAYRSCLG